MASLEAQKWHGSSLGKVLEMQRQRPGTTTMNMDGHQKRRGGRSSLQDIVTHGKDHMAYTAP